MSFIKLWITPAVENPFIKPPSEQEQLESFVKICDTLLEEDIEGEIKEMERIDDFRNGPTNKFRREYNQKLKKTIIGLYSRAKLSLPEVDFALKGFNEFNQEYAQLSPEDKKFIYQELGGKFLRVTTMFLNKCNIGFEEKS